MDGNIFDPVISILIDPRSNYNYVSPNLVDKCGLSKELHAKSCLVQLAIGTKKRVHHWLRACAVGYRYKETSSSFCASYNMLLGMD